MMLPVAIEEALLAEDSLAMETSRCGRLVTGPSGRKQEGLPFEPVAESGERAGISGVVQRVTFQNEENGFCVLRIQPGSSLERVTLVGPSLPVQSGEFVRAQGKWVDDPRHGPQFRAESIRVSAPSTAEGIERYLASGLIHGVGPELAKRMVGLFGAQVLDVIDE